MQGSRNLKQLPASNILKLSKEKNSSASVMQHNLFIQILRAFKFIKKLQEKIMDSVSLLHYNPILFYTKRHILFAKYIELLFDSTKLLNANSFQNMRILKSWNLNWRTIGEQHVRLLVRIMVLILKYIYWLNRLATL